MNISEVTKGKRERRRRWSSRT